MNSLSIRSFRNLAAALALTLTAAVPAMQAQYSASPDLAVVDVPFGFEAGSTHYAAGIYTLTQVRSGLLQIRGGSNSGLLLSRNWVDSKASTKSVAVFHRVGGEYFLSELHTAGSSNYVDFGKSREEARARKSDIALNNTTGGKVDVVTVDALR